MLRSAILFSCLSFSLVAAGQQDLSKVEIETQKVNSHVYMLKGAGGNIAVSAGPDGVLMIDDQFKELSTKIKSAISKISKKPIKFLINTHWHYDHTGSNAFFGKDTLIVAHENVRKRLSKDQFIALFKKKVPKTPAVGLPVVTFPTSMNLHFNGDEIRVIHFPTGHTDGDSIVWFKKANVAHLGDHFFVGSFPFVDLGSGGSVSGYLKNVEKMIAMLPKDVKVIPGHGPLSGIKELLLFKNMIEQTSQYVAGKMAQNISLSNIQKAGLPAKWRSFGKGFIKENIWIGIVYESLVQDQGKKKSS